MKILSSMMLVTLVSLNAVQSAPSAEPTATGLWEQVDDKTGKPESWFNVAEKDGVYVGTVVKMFQKPGDPPPESWRCTKCEGAEKNAPVLGLALIFFIYDLALLWYAQSGHQLASKSILERLWYPQKTSVSFEDILRTLRHATWQERVFSDPALDAHTRKILQPFVEWAKTLT